MILSSPRSNMIRFTIKRPVAISMFFLVLAFLGIFSWLRMPVELIPAFSGQQLYINFYRPSSEPEIIEKEILIPLESKVSLLPGVLKTWGEISSSQGQLNIEFEPDSNYRVRELELRRIAAELTRLQPEGTRIRVRSQDTTAISRFVLSAQVLGGDDKNLLRELTEERIQPHLESVPGVSQVLIFGGASKEITIWLDDKRCAELGIGVSQVISALKESVKGINYVGGSEQFTLRTPVMVDARATSIEQLGEIRIVPNMPVLLRHVAEIKNTVAPQSSISRVNGQASVSVMVFQDQGANLVELGRNLKDKIKDLKQQLNPYSVDLLVSFDASEIVDEQLAHLKKLALSGFAIALIILFLFIKEVRAVAVVAIAVPMSLLTAGAFLYLSGYSLNLITLFGLVIGVGMLVDNSIVVYESVQRNLEKGANPELAAVNGVSRTMRAITTASATNAIVFLPLIFVEAIPVSVREILQNVIPAILYPLAASLLVAIGLVPLLTKSLAAPAATKRLRLRNKIKQGNGKVPPQIIQATFSALLKQILRRPAPWVLSITISILVTLIVALPWILVQSIAQPAKESDQVRIEVEFSGSGTLDSAELVFERLEHAALSLDSIDRVESNFQEHQGNITIHLEKLEKRSKNINAAQVRQAMYAAIDEMQDVQLKPLDSDNAAGNLSSGSGSLTTDNAKISISGPEMSRLYSIAEQVKQRLKLIPQISDANYAINKSVDEILVVPQLANMTAHRLNFESTFEPLISIGREGEELPTGFDTAQGKEIPIVIRRINQQQKIERRIAELPVISQGSVLKLRELSDNNIITSPSSIIHRNGRREISVSYQLHDHVAKSGPSRVALEKQIANIIQTTYKPDGYTLQSVGGSESTDWFSILFIPIVLLLYALLAISFESATLPLVILITVPLTIFGSIWALFLTGFGIDMMAAIGVVVLLGLSINPAILLVDRMQEKVLKGGASGGKAAMSAVRERVRPVLMTSCTTIAGLWPLALAKGQELEVWPPFATVVIGGLITSTILTLLVIPVGFVALSKIDNSLKRLGIWKIMLWFLGTITIIVPLFNYGIIESFTWQIITVSFVSLSLFWIIYRLSYQPKEIKLDTRNMEVDARYLSKVYGKMGDIRKIWYQYFEFNKNNPAGDSSDLKERALALLLLSAGSLYLALNLESIFWQVFYSYVCGYLFFFGLLNITKLFSSKLLSNIIESKLALQFVPWIVLAFLILLNSIAPFLVNRPEEAVSLFYIIVLITLTLFVQLGRKCAINISLNNIQIKVQQGRYKRIRSLWRLTCQKLFSFGLKSNEFAALSNINFHAKAGMIGVLGPNGAGKTTLFRLLASVLESSSGTIHYANMEKRKIGNGISNLIGYLPQEFGLPEHLSAREYLEYFAILYEIGSASERKQRVEQLLKEVGLEDKRDEKISNYSGGMRQRVAVARTLLNEPPLIIVDEPTVGLDPRERIRFRNLLTKLSAGRVVLFSTHVIEDVAASCDRVIVLKKGSLVYDGSPENLTDLAKGKIWLVKVPQFEADAFEKELNVINHTPELNSMVTLRILADEKPVDQAVQVDSTLEDGYFQLFNQDA